MKSFKPEDRGDGSDDDDAQPLRECMERAAERNFYREQRAHATHPPTTDPDARVVKKAGEQAAKLRHMEHALMENRHAS